MPFPLVRSIIARRRSRERETGAGRLVAQRAWPRRHPVRTIVAALVLVAGGLIGGWRLGQPVPFCGPGLTENPATSTCIGLDLAGTELRPGNDPLAPLEQRVSRMNANIKTRFATVVMLENMTPDPSDDSIMIRTIRHDIEGTITAVQQANNTSLGRGQTPKIKLLLANLGSDINSEKLAVDAIRSAVAAQNIAAVTGIEQSLDYTRAAVTDLSGLGIVTVAAGPTADDMSLSVYTNQTLPNYFQVSPTNTEEVSAAINYIITNNYQHVLVVADKNTGDDYVKTLQTAFAKQQSALGGRAISGPMTYRSDFTPGPGTTRATVLRNLFAQKQTELCQDHPDLVYFAGRSIDLREFLTAVEQFSCAVPLTSLDVLTGDDGSNLVGQRIQIDGAVHIQMFYTGLAAPHEWDRFLAAHGGPADNYRLFMNAFTAAGFSVSDLADGDAMMHYDSTLTAAIAIHAANYADDAPSTIGPQFDNFRCTSAWIQGASGFIAYDVNGHAPFDKAMPIMQLAGDGGVTPTGLAWPTGKPLSSEALSC